MEPDFAGYATKNDVTCSDGLTIKDGAFRHQDGSRVPLVWQHGDKTAQNILGYVDLTHAEDGVRAKGFFNDTEPGKHMKASVKHGDITMMSIRANRVKFKEQDVVHGTITEVSLVTKGANSGAVIDFVNVTHADDEGATIEVQTGLSFTHADEDEVEEVDDIDLSDPEAILETFNDQQKALLVAMVTVAGSSNDEEEDASTEDVSQNDQTQDEVIHQEEQDMTRNAFDQTKNGSSSTIVHADLDNTQITGLFEDVQKVGWKAAAIAHAQDYGITNVELLFPEAKALTPYPELIARDQSWVQRVIQGARKTPFTRIKSLFADVTHEEARAKGYIKGTLKKEEFFSLSKRTTGPTTIYKKQKLDRDDILDVTDFDLVSWLWTEIRLMFNEELARAILLGDGREVDHDDKVKDPAGANDGNGIRSILNDDDFYTHKVTIPSNLTPEATIEAILRAQRKLKSSNPVMFTTKGFHIDMSLVKDRNRRRLYDTEASLTSALKVSEIMDVEVMENSAYDNVVAILYTPHDYTLGTDKGGELAQFDQFDIDFNQNKYLLESRVSGALTSHKRALVILRADAVEVVPTAPTQVGNVVTIPTIAGVEYTIDDVLATGTVTLTEDTLIEAVALEGYTFPQNVTTSWLLEFAA